jgi:hypothetical protein
MGNGDQQSREIRAARNEALFRAVNEKLRGLNEAFAEVTETYAIACECTNPTCVQTLHIAMEEYTAIREHADRFVVLNDHVRPDIERVVAQHDGYTVVEKEGAAAEIAESTDPNR